MQCERSSDKQEATNAGGVICSSKDELWGSVVTRADVGDVGLTTYQLLSTAGRKKRQREKKKGCYQAKIFFVTTTTNITFYNCNCGIMFLILLLE